MPAYLIAYLSTAVVFFGMDFAWLSLSMTRFYKEQLGSLLLDKPNLAVGGLFYLLYVVGIVFFAVLPTIGQDSWIRPLAYGLLFGLVAYGTYDMTNLATLRGWSPTVSLVDMAWGSFATGVAATVGYFVTRMMV